MLKHSVADFSSNFRRKTKTTKILTGYPSYTQSQDLIKVFNQYGAVNVDKINNKFAVMTFASETEAVDAIEDSGKVNIYGEFLTVKKFTGKLEPATPKRDFPKSKEKGWF